MGQITTASTALFVLDGATASPAGAAAAMQVLGHDVHWTVASVIAEHPRFTTGATGFASPVLSAKEMDAQATADVIAGDAAAAATAQGFGSQPVTQLVLRGELGGAIASYVDEHQTDLVVVDSPDLASPLIEHGIAAVLVVATSTHDGPHDRDASTRSPSKQGPTT